MDKPAVDRIDGIPPAIAIDQTNPVRTSRSTVGTMTELNDHLKLLFARAGTLALPQLRQAGAARQRRKHLSPMPRSARRRPAIRASTSAFRSRCRRISRKPKSASCWRRRATRAFTSGSGDTLEVVQDRLRLGNAERARVMESLETALRVGRGRVNLHVVDDSDPPKSARALEIFQRAALRGLRPFLSRSRALAVLLQLAGGRLRNLPRLRPHHRHRLRPGHSRRNQDAGRRRGQALADQVVQGMPGRPGQVRQEAPHPARHALVCTER